MVVLHLRRQDLEVMDLMDHLVVVQVVEWEHLLDLVAQHHLFHHLKVVMVVMLVAIQTTTVLVMDLVEEVVLVPLVLTELPGAGNGGDGVQIPDIPTAFGDSGYFAGGGAGGKTQNGGNKTGGAGGAGDGGFPIPVRNATPGTGGGGAGAPGPDFGGPEGDPVRGGGGVVIIHYLT